MSAQPYLSTTTAQQQDDATVARAAAGELARLLPSSLQLTATPFDPRTAPPADAVAVRATFVGATSAELLVVADDALAEMLAGSDVLFVADALRPALEAATATLGPGVLDPAVVGPLGSGLDDEGVIAFTLSGAGAPLAWFGLRLRRRAEQLPQQRTGPGGAPEERSTMRLLHDVEMTLTAEIGRTRLPVRQVLELTPGTVLELDRAAGAPADIMVNGRLVARGEVVVIDEDYGIRITEIVSGEPTA